MAVPSLPMVDTVAPYLVAGTVLFFANAPFWWLAWMMDEEPERPLGVNR